MAASKIFMSPDFLTRFIEEYRELPSLWKVKSGDYMNKMKRDEAWEILLQLTREKIPDVDVNFIKKKVDNIRACFRKELRKMRESDRSGASTDSTYKPTLWYFEILKFIADQEKPRESKSNLDEDVSDVVMDEEEERAETSEKELTGEEIRKEQDTDTRPSLPPRSSPKKRKLIQHRAEEVRRQALVQKAFACLNQETDEFDALGKTYAAKLRRMDVTQRDLADKLINEILFKGLQNQLSFTTTLTDSDYNASFQDWSPRETTPSSASNVSFPGCRTYTYDIHHM